MVIPYRPSLITCDVCQHFLIILSAFFDYRKIGRAYRYRYLIFEIAKPCGDDVLILRRIIVDVDFYEKFRRRQYEMGAYCRQQLNEPKPKLIPLSSDNKKRRYNSSVYIYVDGCRNIAILVRCRIKL